MENDFLSVADFEIFEDIIDSKEFEDIFNSLKQIEIHFKKKTLDSPETNRFRQRMIICYQAIILKYPQQSSEFQIEGSLWRNCFHRQIDEYRSLISMTASFEICRIVDEGLGVFNTLLYELGYETDGFISSKSDKFDGIYRILIYCGDLSRYRTQYNRAFYEENYEQALYFYSKAREFDCTQGLAYNMIAVTLTLQQGPAIDIVYYYCRSLGCEHPFLVSQKNLAMYIEKMGTKDPLLYFVKELMQNKASKIPEVDDHLKLVIIIMTFNCSLLHQLTVNPKSSSDWIALFIVSFLTTNTLIPIHEKVDVHELAGFLKTEYILEHLNKNIQEFEEESQTNIMEEYEEDINTFLEENDQDLEENFITDIHKENNNQLMIDDSSEEDEILWQGF